MKAMQFAFGFGVAIVFPLLIHSGVAVFNPRPVWQDYQPGVQVDREAGEVRIDSRKLERTPLDPTFKSDSEIFARRLFWVASPLGMGAIILGATLQVPAIGTGLVFGGIFALIDAFGNYWRYLSEPFRFVSLLLAFVVLVLMGYRKFSTIEQE